nr:MAG TPA: ferredoxin-thioredoxin reductase [Caudoviricetes sp.]
MKIHVNKDKELVAKVRAALKENGGYCPCRLDKTSDTLCMCKEFREMESGECCCGLYWKEKDPDESRSDKI